MNGKARKFWLLAVALLDVYKRQGRAGVSPPTVQQPHGLSAQLQIAHLSNAVIVDPAGFPAAALADVYFSLHGNLQDDFFLCFI